MLRKVRTDKKSDLQYRLQIESVFSDEEIDNKIKIGKNKSKD